MMTEAAITPKTEVRVGLFAIQMNKISLKKLSIVRKLVPKKEYSLFKNRMSSRISRDRQKSNIVALLRENRRLRRQNTRLQALCASAKQEKEDLARAN